MYFWFISMNTYPHVCMYIVDRAIRTAWENESVKQQSHVVCV